MRSYILICLCLVFSSLAGPASAQSTERPAMERLLQQAMETDPEFAEVEKGIGPARDAFLGMFAGPYRQWAENVIKGLDDLTSSDLGALSASSKRGLQRREEVLQKRRDLRRYLEAVANTPPSDPSFLVLMYPLGRAAGSGTGLHSAPLGAVLAEFDAMRADGGGLPKAYLLRKAGSVSWGAVLYPRSPVGYSSSDDRLLALVVRVEKGKFRLAPIIAPTREDIYPGEKTPLRPEKTERGAHGLYINECQMDMGLVVTNQDGPFSFRADVAQSRSNGKLSYICEPKCSGFDYVWNERSGTFFRQGEECRTDDGWKAKSPFEGNTLVAVREAVRQLEKNYPDFADHQKSLRQTVDRFVALFDGPLKDLAKARLDDWLNDRQYPLYRLVGQDQQMIAKVREMDTAVLQFMDKVLSLAQTPDARLVLLLDEMGRQLGLSEKDRKQESRRNPGPDTLMRGKEVPWLTKYAAGQLALLSPPDRTRSTSYAQYSAMGLEGDAKILFTFDRGYRRDQKPTNSYLLLKAQDGSSWGLAEIAVDMDRHRRPREVPAYRIMRVADGKVAFITPPLPEEKEFFTNPRVDSHDMVQWILKDREGQERYQSYICSMAPALLVDTSAIPFTVTAKDIQTDSAYDTECVPECTIPFTWNGTEYVRGERVCLQEGEWGVMHPERKGR